MEHSDYEDASFHNGRHYEDNVSVDGYRQRRSLHNPSFGLGPEEDDAAPPQHHHRLSRVSKVSVTTTESEESLGLVRPEDDAPLTRFVHRALSFDQEEFSKLLEQSGDGIYNVAVTEDDDARHIARSRPATALDGLPMGNRRRRDTIRDKNHRSIFNVPVFRPDNKYYTYWSYIILLFDATYSAFVVPISIGMFTSFYRANWTSILDYGVGLFFIIDLFLSFHVGFLATYNIRKILVLKGRLIAKYYIIHGSFVIDFLSAMAWLIQIVMLISYYAIPSFDPNTALIVMELLRLARMGRVLRLIRRMLATTLYSTVKQDSKWMPKFLSNQNAMYMLCIGYVLIVLVNFLGCLWNFVAGVTDCSNTWRNYYPPFVRQYSADGIALTAEECEDLPDPWLYLVGIYWALTTIATVGFGDVLPANQGETVVVLIVECIGVMFFGLMISTIGQLMAQVNRKARQMSLFRSKLGLVDRWIESNNLPGRLRRRIRTFYAEVWLRHAESKEETEIYKELPHVLRGDVAWAVCKPLFKKVHLLKDLDEQSLYLLASRMTPYKFGPGHELAGEGQPAERLWLLLEGEILALYHYNEADQIEGPAVIGTSILLQDEDKELRRYQCTYRTLTSCVLWSLKWADIKPLLSNRPSLAKHLSTKAYSTMADNIESHPDRWKGAKFTSKKLKSVLTNVSGEFELDEDGDDETGLETCPEESEHAEVDEDETDMQNVIVIHSASSPTLTSPFVGKEDEGKGGESMITPPDHSSSEGGY